MARHLRRCGLCAIVSAVLWTTSVGAAPAPQDGTVGIRTFREIWDAMTVVTGITPAALLREEYEGLKSRLSKTGRVEDVTQSLLLATTQLAAGFCGQLIQQESRMSASARKIFGAVDFSKGPSQFVSAESRTSLLKPMSNAFWQRDPSSEELGVSARLHDQLVEGQPDVAAKTIVYLNVACTSALASLDLVRN